MAVLPRFYNLDQTSEDLRANIRCWRNKFEIIGAVWKCLFIGMHIPNMRAVSGIGEKASIGVKVVDRQSDRPKHKMALLVQGHDNEQIMCYLHVGRIMLS